jgi:hypothetical protein
LPREQLAPPDDVYVHQRWIAADTVHWVKEADAIMVDNGAVGGSVVYTRPYQARHRARDLIRLMVELRLHKRWELVEHVNRVDGGYTWSVQHIRRQDDARKNPIRGTALRSAERAALRRRGEGTEGR